MRTLNIAFKGVDYVIDIIEEGEEIEIFVEREDDSDEEIPDDELLAVIQYLIKEGFVKDPETM